MTTDTEVSARPQQGVPIASSNLLYTPPEVVLDNVLWRYGERTRGPSRFSWIGSATPPALQTESDAPLVLSISFGTLEDTINRAWEWISEQFPNALRWGGFLTDSDHLRLLFGMEFKPWTLAWEQISLSANLGARPCDHTMRLPGVASLFAAAQHPDRMRAINERTHNGFWISGMHCRSPIEPYVVNPRHNREFPRTPTLTWNAARKAPELSSTWSCDAEPQLAIPTLVSIPH